MQALSFEKVNANLPVRDFERRALYTVATSSYQLMKRFQHWQQATWESLTKFSAATSGDTCLLTFDSHPQLTRLVLATVAKYVKVNLLWTSFRVIPGLLGLYTFLHLTQSSSGDTLTGASVYSPPEHTDHRVREFVLHFGTTPLLAIQQDFQLKVRDKGTSIAVLALSCFERYDGCRELTKLRHQGVFDLESLVSGTYASHSCLVDLLNVSDIADWVICMVLSLPHQLQKGDRTGSFSPRSPPLSPASPSSPNSSSFLQLWDFMEVIARDRLVLVLHRNNVVNLHDLLYQQVTSLTGAASSSFGNSRSTVSLKKSMNTLSKFALRNCGGDHQQRREVALWLLQSCVQLMQHNPGLVAPSFPLLLAALSIARDEVEWAACHRVPKVNTEGYKAPLLPSHVKAKHLQRVTSSFSGAETELAALLTHSHRLRGLIEQHSQLLSEYYQTFLLNGDADGIAYTIQDSLAANELMTELKPLLEGFLDSERYHINSSSLRATWVREWRQTNTQLTMQNHIPLFDMLRSRMECAVRHTQYICVSAQLIEHAANFSKCWWFRDVVFGQIFNQILTTAPSASIGLVEILSSLSAGNYILDELIDTDDIGLQSKRMVQLLDQLQTRLVSQVEYVLDAVVKRDVNFQRDERTISQEVKTEPMENKVTASSRRLSSFSLVQSSQVQRPSNAELRFVIFSNGSRDAVRLRCSIQDACLQIRCVLRATQRLFGSNTCEYECISTGGAIQTMLTKTLADEYKSVSVLPQDKRLLESTKELPRISDKELEQWSLVDRIAWLFISLVTRRCHPSPSSAPGSFPSMLAVVRKNCFVLAPGVSGELDPREYTDPKSLQHLVTLIGSAGVETVCSAIVNLLVAQVFTLRSSIEAEHAVLAFMDMALSGDSSADVVLATAQVRGLDDIATQLIQIGTTGFLLQLLHVHSSHDTSDAWEARVAPRILRELQQDLDRRTTWTRLLPVACSAGFHSSVWKRTSYLSKVDATDTNAHLMGLAMARLLPSPYNSQSVHQCAVAALRRTAACSNGAVPTKSEATRPLLEALELLVTNATSTASNANGPALGELELSLESLHPRAMLVLHSTP
ncbi:Nck-associated protein [Phytophthora megakarya]|uniref:Nck-associated protein n=1 Tax=Phytophthora megakarya TaxID=4795 RepID=A0A225WXH7_9STRA|nr:Nck-associated protein [Phytophthora megakarya]